MSEKNSMTIRVFKEGDPFRMMPADPDWEIGCNAPQFDANGWDDEPVSPEDYVALRYVTRAGSLEEIHLTQVRSLREAIELFDVAFSELVVGWGVRSGSLPPGSIVASPIQNRRTASTAPMDSATTWPVAASRFRRSRSRTGAEARKSPRNGRGGERRRRWRWQRARITIPRAWAKRGRWLGEPQLAKASRQYRR